MTFQERLERMRLILSEELPTVITEIWDTFDNWNDGPAKRKKKKDELVNS